MTSANLTKAECEELLGLSGTYTVDDINRAYREQIKEFHPDKAMNAPEGIRRLAAERFDKITKAQRLLKDAADGRPHFADVASNVVTTDASTASANTSDNADAADTPSSPVSSNIYTEDEFYNTWSGCEDLFADMSPQEIQYVLERLQTAPDGIPYADVVRQAHAEWLRMNEPAPTAVTAIIRKIQSIFNPNVTTADDAETDGDGYSEQYYGWEGGPGAYYGYQKPKKKTSKLKIACFVILGFILLSVFGCGSCVATLIGGDSDNGSDSGTVSSGDAEFSYTDITLDQVVYEVGSNSIRVSAQITNNNDTYLLNKATITVVAYDGDGNVILDETIVSDALLPGQTGFVTETFSVSLLSGLGDVEVYIEEGNTNWITDGRDWLMSELSATGSVSTHVSESWADTNTHELEVSLTNPEDNDTFEDGINVYAGLFDDNGHLVTVLEATYGETIEGGETVETTLLTYTPTVDVEFASAEFYAAPVITSARLLLGG